MLTVAKVTSGQAAGYAIYLESRTQAPELGDYYLRDGERIEAPGRWITGAELIGADAEAAVSGVQLRALMAVQHPETGLPLRRVGGNGQAVSALDLTFSAPKSVSAVWALASPELRQRIEHAHEQAVDQALTYATQQVPMVRRRVDRTRVDHVHAADLIATSWRHTTARAVADQLPDPQLHSHVLLHAAVRGDGQLVAIDSRSVFVHRRELGAAYRTTLAHQLTQLGFAIQRGTGRGARYFEISGVPAGLIEQWSARHHQVHHAIAQRLADKRVALQALVAAGGPDARAAVSSLEALDRSGRLLPSEERFMATHTRAAKNPRTHGDLDQHWHRDARQHDFDTLAVERLRGPSQTLEPATGAQLLQRLTEFDATFSDREARAVALEASAGASIDQALRSLDALDRAGVLLQLADGRQTTSRHRATEAQTVTVAQRLAAQRPNPLPTSLVEHQALALDAELKAHGAQLSPEQHQALALACSDRQLVMIEGQAGTGKSTTLTAIARAHQADGRQIIVTSTAALAAQHLATELASAGVDANAYSTAALQAAINTGTLTLDPDTTVIHDEAALASTREQHHLLQAVQTSDARLILIGDPRQNQAVGAGGLWPDLEHAARQNGAHVRLTRIVRAVNPADRRDQTLFRAGQHQRAIAGYADRGRVHLTDTQQLAEDQALDGAHADRQAGRQTLVICQTSNEHLDALNARAQAIRHQHGELGEHALPLTGRPYGLRSGDQIQIRRPLDHPDLGRVANGTTAHILDIDQDGQATLELSDGRQAALTAAQADAASVRLAYVSHPFPAQGHTTDTTHLIVAEHTTAEGSYVALTRARQQTHIHASHTLLADVEPVHQPGPGGQPERDRSGQLELFTDQPDRDPLQALAERMGRSEPEIASIRTPLAHEQHLARQQARATGLGIDPGASAHDAGERGHEHPPGHEHQHPPQLPGHEHSINDTREPERDERDNTQRTREHDAERELTGRLQRARRACDDAQRVLDSYPAAHAHQHRLAQQKLEQTTQDLANREAWAQQLQAQLDQLGPIARRRQPAQQLKAQLEHNEHAIRHADQRLIELDHDADIHQQIIQAWETDHPDAREHLKTAEHELDALIEQQARQRVERPGQHLTHTLGTPPPPEHPQRGLWDRTALQIERYRTRYQINPAEPAALGQEPEPGSHTRQQRDQLEHARAQITLAATRLHTRAPQPGRAIDPPDLTRPAPHRSIDRGGFSIGL